MVKQRDEHGRVKGIKLRVVFGKKSEVFALFGKSTAYIERSNLASRLFNGRQVRKTLAFSKAIEAYRAAAAWEDCYYNLVRPHKNLRLPVTDLSPRKWLQRTPAMAAQLTDHIWTVKELLTTLPVPSVNNTSKGDYRPSGIGNNRVNCPDHFLDIYTSTLVGTRTDVPFGQHRAYGTILNT